MSAQTFLPPVLLPPVPDRFVRIEYVGFQDTAEHREFRLRVYGRDGSTEFRFRIATVAFGAGRVRLQDGPDVCYQMLLRAVAAGETASPDGITIDDVELASYREAHAKVVKHRPRTPSSSPEPAPLAAPAFVRPRPPRAHSPQLPVAPLVTTDIEPGLGEGQRVRHAVFGVGVTAKPSDGHTVVRFDHDGPKTFVTSMLQVDVLSAPHTWETGPRGNNRLCRPASPSDGGATGSTAK